MTCSCPKRTENGALVCVGRDVFCPIHGHLSREMVPCKNCNGTGVVPKEKTK